VVNWGLCRPHADASAVDSWQKPYASEPPVWFHEILRPTARRTSRRKRILLGR